MTKQQKGMRIFFTIWSGQVVSMLGSGVTSFALGVWLLEETGRATPFTIVALLSILPRVFLLPLAGSWADRYNRRLIMIFADVGAALTTVFVAIMLFASDTGLQAWHIYLIATANAIFGAFQLPAYQASVTMLVPKQHFGRAAGLIQSGEAAGGIVAPLAAGFLYAFVGLRGIILIDFVTFFVAVGTLLIIKIPQPERKEDDKIDKNMLDDLRFAWGYLKARPGLLNLLFFFAMANFLLGGSTILAQPMVLFISGPEALGAVQMAGSLGLLVGSLVMGAWGGPKNRIKGVVGFAVLMSLSFILIGIRPSPIVIGAGLFLLMFNIAFSSGSSQALWMAKVEPSIQGRVFSLRYMLGMISMPLAFALSGPASDKLFEPLMADGGAWASTFGWLVGGTGVGRGSALLILFAGALLLISSIGIYLNPRVRRLDDELPDFVSESEPESTPEPLTPHSEEPSAKGGAIPATIE